MVEQLKNKSRLILAIRMTGWFGVALNVIAISVQQQNLFVYGQAVAVLSSYLWLVFMQGKSTWDLKLSLFVTVLAIPLHSIWLTYAAMLIRSISYQFVFERKIKS